MARDTITDWVREQLARDDDKCVAFVLMHLNGTVEREIFNVRIGSKAWEPGELGNVLRRKAETDAGGLQGSQAYVVYAFFEKSPKEPGARYPLRMAGESDVGGLGTEGPTSQGFMQQMMRHNEVLMRSALQHSQQVMEYQARTIDQLSRQNLDMQRGTFDTMQLAQALVMKAAEDEQNHEMRRLAFARSSQERALLIKLGPGLINSLTGVKIFPDSTIDTAIIEAIAEKLQPEHMPILEQFLPAPQLAILMDRLTEIQKGKNAAKQLEQNAQPSTATVLAKT
jgi:hypothetical protein